MNYAEQSAFLSRYRTIAAAGAFGTVLFAVRAIWVELPRTGWYRASVAALLVVATVYALCYLPLYLRISVETQKRYAWSLRARYILLGVLGLLTAPMIHGLGGAIVWAVAVGLGFASITVGRRYFKRNRNGGELALVSLELLLSDLGVLVLVAGQRPGSPLVVTTALGLAAVVYAVTSSGAWQHAGLGLAAFVLALFAAGFGVLRDIPFDPSLALAPVVAAATAVALVAQADRRHAANLEHTVEELAGFTLVSPDVATEMLTTATSILAHNWNDTRPVGPDAVAAWYEDNSEFYLYDLAQFHLAYKHIAFMRDVIALSRGRVLDFGAGIGDLALELARLGHEAVYVDVEGRTKAFARWRAEREWIPLTMASDLDDVEGRFDTIISLDVFEHLADPLPVVDGLVDRLGPGGRMIVTAAFGATKAHPMHFDHDIDLGAELERRGLTNAKTFAMRHLRSQFLGKPNVLVFEKR